MRGFLMSLGLFLATASLALADDAKPANPRAARKPISVDSTCVCVSLQETIAPTDDTAAPIPTCKKTGCSSEVCCSHDVMTDCSFTCEKGCFRDVGSRHRPDAK